MTKYYYQNVTGAPEYIDTIETCSEDVEDIAKEIAERFWSEGDSQRASWPATFNIFNRNKRFLDLVVVDMEAEPNFYAREILDNDESQEAINAADAADSAFERN